MAFSLSIELTVAQIQAIIPTDLKCQNSDGFCVASIIVRRAALKRPVGMPAVVFRKMAVGIFENYSGHFKGALGGYGTGINRKKQGPRFPAADRTFLPKL